MKRPIENTWGRMTKVEALALGLAALGHVADTHPIPEEAQRWEQAADVLRIMLYRLPVPKLDRRTMPVRSEETLTGERLCRAFEVLDCMTKVGRSPTVRELAALSGYRAHSALWYRLEKWREAGLVTWIDGKARTLRTVA